MSSASPSGAAVRAGRGIEIEQRRPKPVEEEARPRGPERLALAWSDIRMEGGFELFDGRQRVFTLEARPRVWR